MNPKINAFISIAEEDSLMKQAERAEKEIKAGRYKGALHGVPIAVKDDEYVIGFKATGGSKILRNFHPRYDATLVKNLKQAGAIIVGKTNLHEFGYGGTTTNPHFGATRNPWDDSRIPGGSSGGSAAAVASSMVWGATGTDAGGSVRIPSSLCGIVGLKPTAGRVSRYGAMLLCWTMEDIGPLTRSVYDSALMLRAMAARDSNDPTTACAPEVRNYAEEFEHNIEGLRIGIPRDFFESKLADEQVEKNFWKAIRVLEKMGAHAKEFRLKYFKQINPAWLIIIACESSATFQDWARTRIHDFGDDLKSLVKLGLPVLAIDYIKAQRTRRLLMEEVSKILREVDVIATPTTAITAPKIGPPRGRDVYVRGVKKGFLGTIVTFTSLFNLTGHPAISVCNGFTSEGLPTGLQLVGRDFDEYSVFRAAYAYENRTPWHNHHPSI